MPSRRPKLAAFPDVTTSPSWQLLACCIRQRRRLSFEALGALLGCSEAAATRLCRGEDTSTPVCCSVVAYAAHVLNIPQSDLEQWASTPPHGRRGLAVTNTVQSALDGVDNELTKLHRQAVAEGSTTQAFALKLGLSRQRLWVLEREGDGVAFERAIARAKSNVK